MKIMIKKRRAEFAAFVLNLNPNLTLTLDWKTAGELTLAGTAPKENA
jgi:hypothetical protein